jgi:hypothetical protein
MSWLRRDPGDGFFCEAVEGADCKFEVFDTSIFGGIVTEAGERLDEHHDGRDTGAGDFGCIVEWAGGQAVGCACNFADGFVT